MIIPERFIDGGEDFELIEEGDGESLDDESPLRSPKDKDEGEAEE